MINLDHPTDLSDDAADPNVDHPAIFPRSPHAVSDFRRMRRPLAEYHASRRRERGPIDLLPARLPAEYRLAQIDQAVARGWQPWEIAQIVPGPVTSEERARALR